MTRGTKYLDYILIARRVYYFKSYGEGYLNHASLMLLLTLFE